MASARGVPLTETSVLVGQWLGSKAATLRPWANHEEAFHVTPPTVSAATPLPERERHQQAQAPSLDLDAIAAHVLESAALRAAFASAEADEARRRRQLEQDLRSESESWRAKLSADWPRQDAARQSESLELSTAQLDALAERLATNEGLAVRLLQSQPTRKGMSDEELVDALLAKLLAGSRLTHELLLKGDIVQRLLVSGELTHKLLASGELAEQLLADGDLSAKLLSDRALVERLSAKLVGNGQLLERLLADGDFSARLLANGRLTDKLLADGQLMQRLLVDGDFSSKLLAEGRLVDKLLANGEVSGKLLADGDLVRRLAVDGELSLKLLREGGLVEKLLQDGELAAKLAGSEEFSATLLAMSSGTVADRLAADARFVGLVRDGGQPVEDERVPELQAKLAVLAATLDSVRQQILVLQQAPAAGSLTVAADGSVEALMAAMLARYDADKTGRADFALESNGGSVLSTRCSETHTATAASITLFGVPLWTETSNPRMAIQPGTLPGQCWAFRGVRGFLVVQLSGAVKVASVSIEHMPRALSRNNRIDSAPRRMTLLGLAALEDPEPMHLASFEFLEDGPSLQTFPVLNDDTIPPLRMVELQIESNHGNQEYTCLYRFRVHGALVAN